MSERLPVYGISRLRMGTDGPGVTSLVAALGCPLRCRWCINPHARKASTPAKLYGVGELIDELRIDSLYFAATGGGVTFGGGEPLLYAPFIRAFAETCPDTWQINIETSLSVAPQQLQAVLPVADRFIVDVKDMRPETYSAYTGRSCELMLRNLQTLAEQCPDRTLVRVPRIPEFNTEADRRASVARLRRMGFVHLDPFDYILPRD